MPFYLLGRLSDLEVNHFSASPYFKPLYPSTWFLFILTNEIPSKHFVFTEGTRLARRDMQAPGPHQLLG